MKRAFAFVCLALVAGALIASSWFWYRSAQQEGAAPARYLYVWIGDKDGQDYDFIAVVDVRPESPTYARVIETEPVGMRGSMPHHLEYWLPPPGQFLFGNGHHHEQIFLFDISEAEHPRVVRTLRPVPPYRYPHDFMRLPNGNVLVGFLRSEGPSPLPGDTTLPGGHGGIAELDPEGRVIRSASAADSISEIPIRPYAFAPLPQIDRLLTTSAPMLENYSADVVQVWRLSDLQLLHTLRVPPRPPAKRGAVDDAQRQWRNGGDRA
ncbi:MAG: hypothetical protein H0W34_01345 [Pyrinomonadaceae bacterium]|nr:hypothetical protein [Pyrinomonadaceae bacterium]